ncbi:hypothetical protein NC653_028693 [Populus alba x Populus x berolinensis]|uniref:Uncharacterized protein n=1 Tax=Populus alba x Populus x berolinensis TaxID=444605 RepID=A0AAD6Q2C4_9ROSI|nr:hypothetical protein NC653_028693 [Populus alba x Populus x berolinensis]
MGVVEIIEREIELLKMMKREERIIGMEGAMKHAAREVQSSDLPGHGTARCSYNDGGHVEDNDKEAAERRELAERKGGEYATRGCTQENIVSDLLKGKRDGKYIYARARNWCNKKGLGTSEPSCEIDGSGSSSSRVHVQKDSKN